MKEIGQRVEQKLYKYLCEPERLIIEEGTERYSISHIWHHYKYLEELISKDCTILGLSFHSPSLLLASLLFSWTFGKKAVLLDPALRKEVFHLSEMEPGVVILTDDPERTEDFFIFVGVSNQQENVCPHFRLPAFEETALAFFTSGSEGSPKLVWKKGRQIYAELEVLSSMLKLPSSCRVLSFVPVFHIYGFLFALFLPILHGGLLHNAAGNILLNLSDSISRFCPDLVIGSPIHYQVMMKTLNHSTVYSKPIYISSGAPLPPEVSESFRKLLQVDIIQVYGSTETGGIASRTDMGNWQPLPEVKVSLPSSSDDIQVLSPWASFQATDEWVMTTDRGKLENSGFTLLGRKSSLMKFRGKRFSAVEVESVINDIEGVKESAVFTLEIKGEQQLVAVYVLEKNAGIVEKDLILTLRDSIAAFKIPRFFRAVDSIPKNSMGKLNFEALKELFKAEKKIVLDR